MATIDRASLDILTGIHFGLFNALPGAERLAWMEAEFASGKSFLQIAQALTTTYAADYAAIAHADVLFLPELLLGGMYELVATPSAYTWAYNWAHAQHMAGVPYVEVVVEAVTALLGTTNPNFAPAQDRLENLGELARYLADEKGWEPANLLEAQTYAQLVDPRSESVTHAQELFEAARSGLALTESADTLSGTSFTAFTVPTDPGNWRHYINTLQSGDRLTGVGPDASLNAYVMGYVPDLWLTPTLIGIANVKLYTHDNSRWLDSSPQVDFHDATGLRNLVLDGGELFEVRGLRADGLADGRVLTIDARNTAHVALTIDAPGSYAQGDPANPDAQKDLAILANSGTGEAYINIEGAFAGSILGGNGEAEIYVYELVAGRRVAADLLGISSISGFAKPVKIHAADLLASTSDRDLPGNAGFDDVRAATIAVGGGTIVVGNLRSAQDWNGADGFKWIGANISLTGNGRDQVTFTSMADGTRISTGADDDKVWVNELGNEPVLAADSDGDSRGAVLDLGAGADQLYMGSLNSLSSADTTLVGRGAVVQYAEEVFLRAMDRVLVSERTSVADTAFNFIGTQFLQLAVNAQFATNLFPLEQNDDNDLDGSIEADLARFDAALRRVMLQSHETAVQLDPPQPGTMTRFTLHNVRSTTSVELQAFDATSIVPPPLDDRLMSIDRNSAVVTSNAVAKDVALWLSPAAARGHDDRMRLTLRPQFDLDLTLAPTSTDTVGAAASTTDDDLMLVEHLELQLSGGPDHWSVDLNGFGDLAHRAVAPAATAADVSSPVQTSLTITGPAFDAVVDNVNADVITLDRSNTTLRVNAANNYRITAPSPPAGSAAPGNDVFDLRADTVRADDAESAVDRGDYIDMGGGYDTLIVSGDNHLGGNDLTPTRAATVFNDELFANLRGVEDILVDTDSGSAGATQTITLDGAAANKGLERIRFVGGDRHTLHAAIGAQYHYDGRSSAPGTFHLDASAHQGDFNVVLSIAAPPALPRSYFDLHVRAGGSSALQGDNVTLVDTGTDAEYVEFLLTTASENIDTRLFDGAAMAAGDVGFSVGHGSIDRITLLDGGAEDAAGVETSADRFVVSAAWTQFDGRFAFDATAIADTDANPESGGLFISAQQSDARLNILKGSQNQDLIEGSAQHDLIYGGAGADTLRGFAGNDTFVVAGTLTEASGAVYAGGDGVDFLHVSGAVDLAASQVSGIEWVVQRGTATYTLAQLGLRSDGGSFSAAGGGIERLALHGPLAHKIMIVADDGTPLSFPQQVAALRAFADQAGQQIFLPDGTAETRLAIGANNLGIDALLAPLSVLRDEVATAAALTSTAPLSGANEFYAVVIAEEVHLVGQVDMAPDGAGSMSPGDGIRTFHANDFPFA